MTNPDEPRHTTAYQGGNSQELLRSSRFQILAKFSGGIRIMLDIFASDRCSRKKQLTKSGVFLPRCRIFDERMLRIDLGKICALGPCTQDKRIIRFVQQPKDHALRSQQATDCAQHLSKELVWGGRSRENIQTVDQCLDLPAGHSLGSAQRFVGVIAFNRDPYKVRRQFDQFQILRVGASRFAIVHAKSSQDFSCRREHWIRPGRTQPMFQC